MNISEYFSENLKNFEKKIQKYSYKKKYYEYPNFLLSNYSLSSGDHFATNIFKIGQ